MKQVDNIRIHENSTIREAMRIIDDGGLKIALVVDKSNHLIGTISDGDIRRAILREYRLDEKVGFVVHRDPVTCYINESKDVILNKAVRYKVHQIPIIDQQGIVHGIVDVDDLIRPKKYPNRVILMAGGLGTRLRPLTHTTPKPLLKVGNKPIIETIIENFTKYGFEEFLISVNYKAKMIEEYFGDGSAFGVHIDYIHEDKQLGTAGALGLIKEKLVEPFFVMNGDLLTNVNFQHLFDYHDAADADTTMCVREYDLQVPYGVVKIGDGNVLNIEEKPVYKFFVNAGIYLLNPSVLAYVSENEYLDMPTLFERSIADNKTILSFPIREYWLDIGQVDEYEKANIEYSKVF